MNYLSPDDLKCLQVSMDLFSNSSYAGYTCLNGIEPWHVFEPVQKVTYLDGRMKQKLKIKQVKKCNNDKFTSAASIHIFQKNN